MENIDINMLMELMTFENVIKFLIIYFFVIWIALLVWVIRDISSRTHSLIYQFFGIMSILILTPFGIFIYLLIRPSKTLYEKYYDEIEENLDLFHEIIEERKKELEIAEKEKEKSLKKKVKKQIKKDEKLEIVNEHKTKEQNKKED